MNMHGFLGALNRTASWSIINFQSFSDLTLSFSLSLFLAGFYSCFSFPLYFFFLSLPLCFLCHVISRCSECRSEDQNEVDDESITLFFFFLFIFHSLIFSVVLLMLSSFSSLKYALTTDIKRYVIRKMIQNILINI